MTVAIYAGIGSRKTPEDILQVMYEFASRAARNGWLLRSGHARGADQAFEMGAGEACEIYLPWASYESQMPVRGRAYLAPTPRAFDIAQQFHDGWPLMTQGVKRLMARNTHQILGPDVDSPVLVTGVVCWTSNGSLDGLDTGAGGTGQALRIADSYGIPVINLARADHLEWAKDTFS